MSEPLELEFDVACSPEHAFDVWASKTTLWWPKGHSVSGEDDLAVTIEPHPGGRIYERTTDGTEHDWGEVTAWEPPRRLAFLSHIAWDRSDATQVEVTFSPSEDGTRVAIVHHGWETFGADASKMRERNRAGWSAVVEPFRSGCAA